MSLAYNDLQNKEYIRKIRNLMDQLPLFSIEYFRHISNKGLSVRTRYAYAIELKNFFTFLTTEIDLFCDLDINGFDYEHLSMINDSHIELYIEHASLYFTDDDRTITNQERSKARKISALRSFFNYYYKTDHLKRNVAALIETPKIHDKAIVRLEANEVADLLDHVEAGTVLTKKEKQYHNLTQIRDSAIMTLFLGTGIRISELVGLDIKDIDLTNRTFLVTRKGGKQDILAFGNEVYKALSEYMLQREKICTLPGNENALFLSIQRRRITVRAVEKLVGKYASSSVPLKHITPHKLRSTFGTMLYQESGDIYLVADVLGHKDVNTTKKHYAAQSELNKQRAAKMIHLREED